MSNELQLRLGPRLRRADFIFGVFFANFVYFFIYLIVFGGVSLQFDFGLRTDPSLWLSQPLSHSVLNVLSDLFILFLCYRRLNDADLPGWIAIAWALVVVTIIAAGYWVAELAFLSEFDGVVGFLGLIAIVAIPPTIGPNRYGPDPRGWASLEQYEAQAKKYD